MHGKIVADFIPGFIRLLPDKAGYKTGYLWKKESVLNAPVNFWGDQIRNSAPTSAGRYLITVEKMRMKSLLLK